MRKKFTNEFSHSPDASLDYGIDYSAWLDTGETIVNSSWTVTGGLTLSNESTDGITTSVFVTGGTNGTVYKLVNTVTTSSIPPRVDSRVLYLSCKL